jgi:hypothetical protein
MQETANIQATGQNWRRSVEMPASQGQGAKDAVMALGLLSPRMPNTGVRFAPAPRELLAQCPKCKTMETLQFVGSTLLRCRKFRQENGRIYHDCGSDQPCRLHE